MKKSILIVILFMAILSVAGQNPSDTIEVHKKVLGYGYRLDGKYLNFKQLKNIVKPNEQSFKYVRQAQTGSFFANLFSYVGGAMIGFPIGTAIGGGDPDWDIAGLGAGIAALGIAFTIPAHKKINKAVLLYNSSLQPTSNQREKWRIGLADTGLGIKITF